MKIDDFEKPKNTEDDFFKMAEEQWKPKNNYVEENIFSRIKNILPVFLPIITFILLIVIGAATVFFRMQLSAMNENLIYLNKIVNTIDTASLQSEITAMGKKIEGINKENDKLKSDVAYLKNELDTIKARKEKIDAPVQKKPAAQKKPANKNHRVR